MKKSLIPIFFILTFILLSNCRSYDLLNSEKKKEYIERDEIIIDSTSLSLFQRSCYTPNKTIDAGSCSYLEISFLDTVKAKEKRILFLEKDTNIIKVKFDSYSVWDWSEDSCQISGQIEIIKWDTDKIVLKQDISVIDFSLGKKYQKKNFKGNKVFYKNKGECDKLISPKLINNSYQCHWKFSELKNDVKGEILEYSKPNTPCGTLASASVAIVKVENDTMRVISLYDFDDYEKGEAVIIKPAKEPKSQVYIPSYLLISGTKGGNLSRIERKALLKREMSIWHTNKYDKTVLKTIWGKLAKTNGNNK